jgi:hypothetical protein
MARILSRVAYEIAVIFRSGARRAETEFVNFVPENRVARASARSKKFKPLAIQQLAAETLEIDEGQNSEFEP